MTDFDTDKANKSRGSYMTTTSGKNTPKADNMRHICMTRHVTTGRGCKEYKKWVDVIYEGPINGP